ncbi:MULTISPECIES: envelope stress response membrane protein PspC [Hyphomonas]|jgi:phage shock protein C|uniref:envelope stress response membrane protein PspC n=1 Tax=Hyphomonas TaxID=85 RepID=UPI000B6F4212|nr:MULTISPECIES: envelope stress response membrane protein PspC [Hyphomonas]MAH93082.1 envelope stress response membrane protein PspC [Hyphomonas sp.]OUX86491.1 MAG: envelope stress response membrane protein PspC [Hyphomonas sp. TMED31]
MTRHSRPYRDTEPGEDRYGSPNPKRYYRSRRDKVIAGVCGGLAERFGWEPILVRLLAILAFFFIAGPIAIIAYIVVWMITPRTPLGGRSISPEEDAFWRSVNDRPRATFGTLKYTFMDLDERLRDIERKVTSDEWRLRKEFRDLERGN